MASRHRYFPGLIAALAVLAGLVLQTSLTSAATMRCAACGKVIGSEQFIKVDGKYFHLNHFTCAQCGRPIGQSRFFESDGKYYDSLCFREHIAPRCALCGQPLEGSYVVYEGKNYHDSCYAAHIVPRCSLCGDTIDGKYFSDEWGNKYHARHKGVDPRCTYCGRFFLKELTGGGAMYPDGRAVCPLCLATAITDLDTAKAILLGVRDSLTAHGIEIKGKKFPLKLLDQRELDRIAGVESKSASGYTYFEKSTTFYGLVTDRSFQIYALTGMPRRYLELVLAHELMHVWLGMNAPMDQNNQMVEGSCNYASYVYLRGTSGAETEFFTKNIQDDTDSVYGDGFRLVKTYVEANGQTNWLKYLKKNKRPPWQ